MSQKAVSFIHDILTEVLTDWSEPPHFHFNEALFRPFERIMQLELCDEDVQDQVSVTWLRHPVLLGWRRGREKPALYSGSRAVFPSR